MVDEVDFFFAVVVVVLDITSLSVAVVETSVVPDTVVVGVVAAPTPWVATNPPTMPANPATLATAVRRRARAAA